MEFDQEKNAPLRGADHFFVLFCVLLCACVRAYERGLLGREDEENKQTLSRSLFLYALPSFREKQKKKAEKKSECRERERVSAEIKRNQKKN